MTDDEALKVLVALGDSRRFDIFRKLQQAGELTAAELNSGKAASTMSHHLKKLVDAGVVEATTSGKNVRYKARRDTFSELATWANNQSEVTTFERLTKWIEDHPL